MHFDTPYSSKCTFQKGLHPKPIPSIEDKFYSDVYFVFSASQNKDDLQWWMYQTKQGVTMYADSLYQTLIDSSNLSLKELNQVYSIMSQRILLSQYLPIHIPKPPTKP